MGNVITNLFKRKEPVRQKSFDSQTVIRLDSQDEDLISFLASLDSNARFISGGTDNNENLITRGYASNADVYSIVSTIAMLGSQIPIDLVDVQRDGTEEIITEGELYDLIQNPNEDQEYNDFMEEALIYMLLSGNNYFLGLSSGLFGDQFEKVYNAPPQKTLIQTDTQAFGGKVLHYTVESSTVDPEKIGHVKLINPTRYGVNSKYGLSPITAGYFTLRSSSNRMAASASILNNKGVSGIVTNDSEVMPFDPEQAKALQKKWQEDISGANNFGKINYTSAKLRFLQMGMSPADLKLIEGGVYDLRTLCNLYHISSRIFNDPDNTAFNNVVEASKSTYTRSVIPYTNKLVKGLNRWLIPHWANRDGRDYKLKLNLNSIEELQQDAEKKAKKEAVVSQSVLNILKEVGTGSVSPDSAINMLVQIHEYTEEEAKQIVANTGENETED